MEFDWKFDWSAGAPSPTKKYAFCTKCGARHRVLNVSRQIEVLSVSVSQTVARMPAALALDQPATVPMGRFTRYWQTD